MELLLILVVALIVIGPTKLPELARKLGRGLAELKKTQQALTQEFTRQLYEEDKIIKQNEEKATDTETQKFSSIESPITQETGPDPMVSADDSFGDYQMIIPANSDPQSKENKDDISPENSK